MSDRPFAYVCSPLRGDIETNMARAIVYSRQVYEAGYCPITPHIYFPTFLNDGLPNEREEGMKMGVSLLSLCKVLVVCGNELTEGMKQEIRAAERFRIPILTLDAFLSETVKDCPAAVSFSIHEQINAIRKGVNEEPQAPYLSKMMGDPRDTGNPEHEKLGGVIRAYIANADLYEAGELVGVWHPFPTTKEKIQESLKMIGVDGVKHEGYYIDDYETGIDGLYDHLPLGADIDELNYLSVKIGAMTEHQRRLFDAVIEAGWHCGGMGEIIDITENTKCFELQVAFNEKQYGERLLFVACEEHGGLMNSLEQSSDLSERKFAEYVDDLRMYIDVEAYGRNKVKEEGGVFTKQGYITESGDFKGVYHGQEDIPSEYRGLVSFPIERTYNLIKVIDTDLSALLLEMHAVGGEYMKDAKHNLEVLATGGTDFFVMMNNHMLSITPAEILFHRDTTEYETWMLLDKAPDIRTFVMLITERGEERVIGSLFETPLEALQQYIRSASFYFTHLDAEMKDGSSRLISIEEWDAMDRIDLDQFKSWVKHYDPADEARLITHLDVLRWAVEVHRQEVPASEFLSQINVLYISQAKNPQPDMLRVTMGAAKVPDSLTDTFLNAEKQSVVKKIREGRQNTKPKKCTTSSKEQTKGGQEL